MSLPPLRRWDRGGTPVLALHCSLAYAGEWAGLAAALPALSLLAPDLPGHGGQAPWDGVTDAHAQAVAQAAAVIEAEGQGPLTVIGHSWGATVALRLALERPGLVAGLVLVEPVLFAAAAGTPAFAEEERSAAQVQALLGAGQAEAAVALFHARWGAGSFASLPAGARAYMAARIRLVLAQDAVLSQDMAGLLAPGRLEALALPVTLVEGGASPPVVAAIQSELRRRLPQARRVAIPGAGHMLPVTHAKALAQILKA